MGGVYGYKAKSLDGREVALSDYQGKVMLIVNTASKCGFTPQYAGLEEIYSAYRGKGLTILGFPCNQFGRQEPGGAEEISAFCERNYGVTFPMFEKIEVNGANAHPLYQYLKDEKPGLLGTKTIKWNFTKFLVDRTGKVVARFAPTATPARIRPAIEKLL
ncbi:MAG TPA: glutathione peroxidase [Xanthobacteraceae bacterium]|nr:glutathione peroxidase [Xanthobacteraceae bacterium]